MADSGRGAGRPASQIHPATGLFGVVGMAAALAGLAWWTPPLSDVQRALCVCVAAAVPMAIFDLFVLRVDRRAGGVTGGARDWRRIGIKLLGLYAAFAAIALGYWLFPEYHGGFYRPFFSVLFTLWPYLVAAALVYVAWLDPRLQAPRDGCYHAGLAVCGRWQAVDGELLGQFARGWLVKAFFLPLMVVFLTRSVAASLHGLETGAAFDARRWFGFFFELTFTVDLVFVTIGYTLTLRALDTHIRSAEPTLLGWAVALACYQPFWGLVNGQYLAYNADGLDWGAWLGGSAFSTVWGVAIVSLSAFYAWASVAFGLRFSNLTHRGIITAGAYRFTKHPAYIAKNLTWWLIAVPFISTGPWWDALRACLLLLLVNTLYYLRARTEERHLAQDPAYVAYAQWIARHGLLRKAGVWVPALFAFRWRSPGEARAALGLRRADLE